MIYAHLKSLLGRHWGRALTLGFTLGFTLDFTLLFKGLRPPAAGPPKARGLVGFWVRRLVGYWACGLVGLWAGGRVLEKWTCRDSNPGPSALHICVTVVQTARPQVLLITRGLWASRLVG